ncbi:MAG: hypothetical protein IPK03_07635 [Bacteroidetes bacterium]|nr:hypothetical protein [Bacteroidota bacterium]
MHELSHPAAIKICRLILMDIFVQMSIPPSCLSETFLHGLAGLLNPQGTLLINTIPESMGAGAD